MKLYFIRHGKTEANEKHLYCGTTDVPLSNQGKYDASLQKRQRRMYPGDIQTIDYYVTSGKRRTLETLDILFDIAPEDTIIMPELEEMNFGIFEMKSYEQLKDTKEYQIWISNIEKNPCPLGESQEAFINRIKKGLIQLENLLKDGEKSAVIITHGGVIAQVMSFYFPGKKNFYEWQPDFLHGYAIELVDQRKCYDII